MFCMNIHAHITKEKGDLFVEDQVQFIITHIHLANYIQIHFYLI